MTQRDWQKDMDFILREKERVQLFKLPTDEEDIAIHWLHEAKESGERELRLQDVLCIIAMESDDERTRKYADHILTTLYPDTPAPKDGE